MLTVVGVILVVATLWPFVRRANEVFCMSVRNGEALLVRGALPPGLEQALIDTLRRARVHSATLRGVRRDQRTVLVTSALDANLAQQLRNVFDCHGGVRVGLAAPYHRGRRRNLGQRLGWSWLAWRLRR